jgi:hypothetical protein
MDNLILDMLREKANNETLDRIKEGKLTSDELEELLPYFLSCNLVTNPQILDILEVMAGVIMKETMEKEYVVFFLNKIRELANKADGVRY